MPNSATLAALSGKAIVPKAQGVGATDGSSAELVQRSFAMILPQTRASTPIAVLTGAMYGFIYVPAVGWTAYLVWYLAVCAGFIGRQVYFERLIKTAGTTESSLFRVAAVSAVPGWISALSIALFSPYLSISDLGVLTIIMVGTVTVAVSILCVQPTVYLWYVIACLLCVFAGWAWQADGRDLTFIGISLVLGGSLLVRLARLLAAQLRETVAISREKAQLVNRLELALSDQQETQRARSRFLGAASHDLRQPVQALLFLIDLFRKKPGPLQANELSTQIVRTAESIDAMFRHLVDFAQIDAGTLRAELQPVHLETVIRAAASGFAEKCAAKGLVFTLLTQDRTVLADPVLLERLLRNFLDNAFKYSLAGEISLRVRDEAGRAVVEVRDQGVGMEDADLEQAFNAFFRGRSAAIAEAEGIGLGLAICKHMAGEMQARLRLQSRPNHGTVVTVALAPADDSSADAALADDSSRTRPALDGINLVVLEDDRIARDAFVLWLRAAGARVSAGADLDKAREALRESGRRPDFIVADFYLRNGNGAEAIAAIRQEHGDIPALLLSGEPSLQRNDLGTPVLQKPVNPDRLLEQIRSILHGKGESAAAGMSR
jgi:two-component system, sensor histidine kinase